MRRSLAIIKATALEMLSEPLSLLILLAALKIAAGIALIQFSKQYEQEKTERR